MSAPRTVQVLSTTYQVRHAKTELELAWLGEDWGVTRHARQLILLQRDQGPDAEADTLLHEVLHACWFQTALASDTSLPEETIVRALTPVLLDVLRRNPALVRRLV